MQNKSKNQGLTLVEVAIVLVIFGLIIGLGTSLIGPLTKRAKITETRDIVNAAVESEKGFAEKNNRLPTNTEFPQAVRNPNDAWTKPLVYFVDSSLTTSSNNPSEGICGRKATNLIVCTDVNCNNQIPDVAFIVVSGGPNYNVQTGPSTTSPCPSGKTCYKVYPQDTPNVDDYPNDFTRQEEYDDIVKWVTIDELRIKAGCQGAQLKILNNELPQAYVIIQSNDQSNDQDIAQYNATIYAEGGVPFQSGGKYKWCIQGNLPSGLSSNPSTSSSDCSSLSEASWVQADKLTINGKPTIEDTAQGTYTYPLTFFVRDNQDPSGSNDNIAQKTLVLTIHPYLSEGCRK
jgi:prepilin-type N-terminal cleavage/methylation domain-containing protein